MLNGQLPELETYFERHNVPAAGREFLRKAMVSPPQRRVGGGGGNVVVRFASKKMRRIIQAESRQIELAFVEHCEHDPNVTLFLCQPAVLQVRIVDSLGRERPIRHVPDYLVLDDRGFALVECKPVQKLRRDAASDRPRFVRDGSVWRWPAAEAAVAGLGIEYRIFSSEDVNVVWYRNIRYLSDFVGMVCPDSDLAKSVRDRLSESGSMRVHEVLALPGMRADVLWWLVANGEVCADLKGELIFDTDVSSVHASIGRMVAARHQQRAPHDAAFSFDVCPVRVEPGARLRWDGRSWTVFNRGDKAVTLRADVDGQIVEIPIQDFEQILQSGSLQGDESDVRDLVVRRREELFRRASDQALAEAERRLRLLELVEKTGVVPRGESEHSIKRHRRWAREGEQRFGSRFAGLVRRRGRLPGTSGLSAEQQEVLEEIVQQFVVDPKGGRMMGAYARLCDLCEERNVNPIPSYETLRQAVRRYRRSDLVSKREGARAAYQVSGPYVLPGDGVPPGPDRVFELAHVDHTPLDVQLVSRRTGARLGTPWLSLMVDALSRLPLAASLSLDEPSRASLSKLLFDCASRHHRLPDRLMVDQGVEFHSKDFEIALAALGIHKVERPAAQARFGSLIERAFGISNTRLIHELLGNTRLARRGRDVSATHDPKRLAVWTFALIHEVCERWLFQVYPDLIHGSLGAKPREVFDLGLARSGERVARYVVPDDSLRILLAWTPATPTRKVDGVRGIVIDHLRYWHNDFATGDVAGSRVEVKVDPADCCVAFARVRGRWVTCRLADGDADLTGRSRKQIRLAVEELQGQRRVGAQGYVINAKTMGRFLREVDHQGELARQMERDAETSLVVPSREVQSGSTGLRLVKGASSDLSHGRAPSSSSAPLELASDDDDALDGVGSYDSTV